ncbi:MAG: hypothetical protein F6K48_06950 [Okeania sp. SIO3H1]|nr:hypothetical protein [Okeania sp. SIO3H1]
MTNISTYSPQPNRKKMVFGCGLSRTGNKSLGRALKILGYNQIKYPESIDELGTVYDAAVDITVIAWLDKLDTKFPDAKWILTVREMEQWLKSCENWFNRSLDNYSPEKQLYMLEIRRQVYGTEQFSREIWQDIYQRNFNRVVTKFSGGEDRLLIFNICQGESWSKLCNFLGKTIPDTPFPSIV